MKTILILLVGVLYLGVWAQAKDVEDRAQTIGVKDCYTNQDIEYIVFGTIQE